jgi:hypothetical protein
MFNIMGLAYLCYEHLHYFRHNLQAQMFGGMIEELA